MVLREGAPVSTDWPRHFHPKVLSKSENVYFAVTNDVKVGDR
jgi:hypothetical protein